MILHMLDLGKYCSVCALGCKAVNCENFMVTSSLVAFSNIALKCIFDRNCSFNSST